MNYYRVPYRFVAQDVAPGISPWGRKMAQYGCLMTGRVDTNSSAFVLGSEPIVGYLKAKSCCRMCAPDPENTPREYVIPFGYYELVWSDEAQ